MIAARIRQNLARLTTFELTPRLMWRIYAVAALVMLPAVFIQYVGEEAVTVIIAQEMREGGEFIVTTLYGRIYGRPGLFPGLIALVASLIGWSHILIAARLVALAATFLTGLVLAWFVARVLRDRLLAAFAAVVYLSGDTLVHHGWLAYTDPLFGLFVFGATTCLWVALEERRPIWFVAAGAALAAAFLTKTLTAYVFHAGTGLALAWLHPNRRLLLHPLSLLAHGAALAVPFAWSAQVGGNMMVSTFLGNVGGMLGGAGPWDAVWAHAGHAAAYPVLLAWNLLPASAIAACCVMRRGFPLARLSAPPLAIAVSALALGVAPYWLSAEAGLRYMIPLYPLFALVLASIILQGGAAALMLRAQVATIALAFVVITVGFPVYERVVRGDYGAVARQVLALTHGQPLYALDDSSAGLSLVAHLNILRAAADPPLPPLTTPPPQMSAGYVLADRPDAVAEAAALPLRLGHGTRYLLCKGAACAAQR